MGKKLEHKEIIEKDLFGPSIKSAEQFEQALTGVLGALKAISKEAEPIIKGANVEDVKQLKELEKALNTVNEVTDQGNKLAKEREKLQEKLAASRTQEAKEVSKLRVENQEQNKVLKEQARAALGLTGEYKEAAKRLAVMRKRLKDNIIAGRTTGKTFDLLSREVDQLDRRLKDADAAAGQFQRNVGDYPQVLGAAQKSMSNLAVAAALLGNELGGASGIIEANEDATAALAEEQGELGAIINFVQNRAVKLGKGLFDIGKAAITGEGGLTSLFIAMERVSESLSTNTDGLDEQRKAGREAAAALRDLREANLESLTEVERLSAEIEKQNVIAGDSTRSFDEIAEAVDAANRAEIKRISILKAIATEELRIIGLVIEKTTEDANRLSLLEEQAEKQRELIALEGELTAANLTRTKEARENARDRAEIELDFAIDAFDAQKMVNERIIADDRQTLERRAEVFDRTVFLADKSFKNQIKIVEDFLGQQTNIQELALIDDEEIIRERLELFTADEKLLTRILEIIRERKAAVQDLKDAEQDLTDTVVEQAEERIAALNELEQLQLEGQVDRVNRELEAEEISNARRLALIEERFITQRQALEFQAEFERNLAETTAEQELVIEQRLANDLANLEQEKADAVKAANEEITKSNQETAKKTTEQLAEIGQAIVEEFKRRSEEREAAIDEEIANSKDREKELAAIAQKGSEDATDNLAFEQRRQAELQQAKQKEQEKQRRAELASTAIQTYNAKVQAGENSQQAVGSTIKDITLLTNAIKNLPIFLEGTEDTGPGGGVDGNGGFLSILHPHERVMDQDNNRKTGGMSNDKLADVAERYNSGLLLDAATIPQQSVLAYRFASGDEILRGFEKLTQQGDKQIKAIKDLPGKMPVSKTDYDNILGMIKDTEKRNNRLTTTHKRISEHFKA